MKVPQDHPLRNELNDEIHARPPLPKPTPAKISYLALISPPENGEAERAHLAELFGRQGLKAPDKTGNYLTADFGAFELKWERHTEFTRYTLVAPGGEGGEALTDPAVNLLPQDWVAGLHGSLLVATNIALLRPPSTIDAEMISRTYFGGNLVTGSQVGAGAAAAITDFRIGPDGFTRAVIFNSSMLPRQTGRMVQRFLEIDTYRMMALLAFPIARELGPFLAESEGELAKITAEMTARDDRHDEALLDRLTRLEAAIRARYDNHHYRFRAANAYAELVERRIRDLRESRLDGFQPLGQFMERRLTPAMSTCHAVSQGIEALSGRVGHSTQLLSTRVDIAREQQNQKLLEAMARRAKLQLRLQQTVEGLSVAAISYYVVGLVGYAAKALADGGLPINADVVRGISVPVVVLLAALGLRSIRRRVSKNERDEV